jgi:hypothetical protein
MSFRALRPGLLLLSSKVQQTPAARATTCTRSARRFSDLATSTSTAATTSEASLPSRHNPPFIIRHGPGDGLLCLNVGGTEFRTLRSTVQSNPVLHEHVLRAAANQEFTSEGNAVFIDRDPAQFRLILQHLRNHADSLDHNNIIKCGVGRAGPLENKFTGSFKKGYRTLMIQIPKDRGEMQELFVEARHYQIKELEDALCKFATIKQKMHNI